MSNVKKESFILIKEVVDKKTKEKYIYPPVKYDGFEKIYFFHEKLGDKIKIYYHDINELHKLKNRKVKLLDHGDRISEKDYDFIKSLANLDDELSKCCYKAIYSKSNECIEDKVKRKETKRTYKIF